MIKSSSDVKSIFGRAIDLQSPAERATYLDEACQGNVVLRAEIEELIGAVARAGNFLDPVSWGEPTLCNQDANGVGALIGPYKLLEQIGEGGMGLVYMAEQQPPLRRRVALKIVKPGMDSRQVIARFEAERQALAIMDQANIAKVLDAGTTDAGRSYFVMELVKGVPITKYCDEMHLTIKQRLELFVPICQAIQHAHHKGIIHRDIKPTNVLVALYDGVAVPKVIDFGVAKATGQKLTEKTMFTGFGQLIGTLEYMSPEQAQFNQLDIDTRSDIYSLGVLLYELLTGSTPLEQSRLHTIAFDETLRIIRQEEPPKPSTRLSAADTLPTIAANRNVASRLRRQIRGELDWIVMKCLEKDRNRRYETANALADDLQRYLSDEPVEACPPSANYRLRKYARKYQKVLASIAAFGALLVAATVVSSALASWAIKERNRAEDQKQTAEANFKRALGAVDQMLTRVSEDHLAHVPQMEPVRRDLLKDALRFYQEFLSERGDSPLVRSEAASAYTRMGQIQAVLGERNEAEAAYRQAIALLHELLAESPDDPGFRTKLAAVHHDLCRLYFATQRWPQAESTIQEGIAILEQLRREDSENLENRHHLASSQANLINVYRQMGRLDDAEKAFLQSTTILDGLLADDPENFGYLTLQACCYQDVALVYSAQGRNPEAEVASDKAVALNQRLVDAQPSVVEHQKRLAQTYNNRGLFYSRTRQYAKAEWAYRQSLALNEATLRDHPQVVSFIVEVAGSYGNLATNLRTTGSPEESLELYGRAIRMLDPVLERDARDVYARMTLFDTFLGRAWALLRLDRHDEAAQDFQRATDVSAGQDHINMRLYRLMPLARLGKYVQATAEIETLLAEGHAQATHLFSFASVHSLCSAAAAADTQLPQAEREKLADEYAVRACELLGKARAAGYSQLLSRIKESKNFDAIRSRPDFQALLVELEKEEKPTPDGSQ